MKINLPVLLIGAVFFATGVYLLVKQLKSSRKNTASVMAEVVRYDMEQHTDSDNDISYVYYPVMRYYVNGQWYENRNDIGRGKQKYNPGEHVEILYDPNDPDHFIIAGDRAGYILAIAGIVIGIGVCLLSMFAD